MLFIADNEINYWNSFLKRIFALIIVGRRYEFFFGVSVNNAIAVGFEKSHKLLWLFKTMWGDVYKGCPWEKLDFTHLLGHF